MPALPSCLIEPIWAQFAALLPERRDRQPLGCHRAPARSAMIYVDDPDTFADRLGLREVQVGANVLVATGAYDVVYDRSQNVDGVSFAAPSQNVVDLFSGPGRNPAEAEALLEWMERNPDVWRR